MASNNKLSFQIEMCVEKRKVKFSFMLQISVSDFKFQLNYMYDCLFIYIILNFGRLFKVKLVSNIYFICSAFGLVEMHMQ